MKTWTKVSGVAYLLIFISGFYANFAILESLIDLDNGEITTVNIINNSDDFRRGLIGFLIMLTADIILIWSLFGITKDHNKPLSYMASVFRALHSIFFALALYKLLQVYLITHGAVRSFELQNYVLKLLLCFDRLWTIGLLFFGIHLFLLGITILKTKVLPKYIGVLLVVAALGYSIDGYSKLYLSSYSNYKYYFEAIVIFTAVIGEFVFTLWLLRNGFSSKKSLE